MPNALHQYWKKTKDDLAKAAADMKKTGGNARPIEEALKSFDSGLGPLLENVGNAYKANKGADVKKHAKAALEIATKYKKTVSEIPYQCRIEAGQRLTQLGKNLTELKDKGMTANDYFKKL
jgi:hypothetical protein